MATITPRKNKKGEVVSYQIEVYRGRDSSGKKLKPFSTNWKVPKGWKKRSVEKELQKVANTFELECKAGEISIDKRTFEQYATHVMELVERDDKHRTALRYKQLLPRINNEIGRLKLLDVTGEHLNAFYLKLAENGQNKRTGGGLSSQTILYHHRLIHRIYAQAIKEGLIHFNPADAATPPKHRRQEAKFFEIDEVLRIMEALKNEPIKWQAIVRLMIDTGARRGEVMGLKWDSINFSSNSVTISNNVLYSPERGVYEDTTKTDMPHTISIAPEVVKILKYHRKQQLEWRMKMGDQWQENNFCFTTDSGRPMHPDSVNTYLSRFAKKYELPHISPHKFRHTQASLLYGAGENPITISKRLGHKQVSTTQNIYAHLLKDSDKNASDCIANLLYRNKA